MANSIATVTRTLSYTGPSSEQIVTPKVTFHCPYKAQSVGVVDIPDGSTDNQVFDIPFGAVSKATLVLIQNNAGMDIKISVNGNDGLYKVVSGGDVCPVMASDVASNCNVSAMSIAITDAMTATSGSVSYHIFGDPEAAP